MILDLPGVPLDVARYRIEQGGEAWYEFEVTCEFMPEFTGRGLSEEEAFDDLCMQIDSIRWH